MNHTCVVLLFTSYLMSFSLLSIHKSLFNTFFFLEDSIMIKSVGSEFSLLKLEFVSNFAKLFNCFCCTGN